MKFNKLSKTLSMTALTAAMAVAPAINVFAAPEDIIDTTKKASLTIHKYDMTAAQQDGINVDEFKDNANGKQDATAETTFADYVIKGVEFTYAKVGEINTESINGKVEVVYDVPKELATILNLQSKVGRTNDKYSSDEINEAMATALVDNTATKGKLEDYIKTGVYFVTDGTQVKQDNGTIIDDYSKRPLTEEGGTVFTPGKDGTFIIKGLEADEYVLTELRTDAGFNLLKEPITINIKCTEDDFTPSKTTLYDSKDKAANQNKHMIETNGARAKATVDGSDTKMEESKVTVEGESANTLVSTNSLVVMQVTNTPGNHQLSEVQTSGNWWCRYYCIHSSRMFSSICRYCNRN